MKRRRIIGILLIGVFKTVLRVGFAILLAVLLSFLALLPISLPITAHPVAPAYQNMSEVGLTSGTEITIPAPTGFSAGDLFVVFITKDDDVLINEDGDWTTLHRVVSGTGCAIYCAWRIAQAGDISWTWTGDSEAYYGVIFRYTGHDPTTPINISDVAIATDAAPTAPSVETTSDDCIVFRAFGADDDDVPYTSPGSPFVERFNDSYVTTGGAGGDEPQTSAGQTGTGVFGMNAIEEWGAVTVAIQPPTGAVVVPTVTTQAASDVEATTATGNGNITNTGGENCDYRGVEWDTDSGAPYSYNATDSGDFGTGAFTKGMTTLPTGTTIYYRAMAHNSAGWGYGDEVTFLTKPAAPTNVQATDGDHTDKVVITWTKSTGATEYQVYRDDSPLGWLGDVATYDDTGADAPTITPGTASASDGTYIAYIALSLSGQSANNGTTHTYKVRAKNATGESANSSTNTGYRGVGALTYQWQRSAADSDADYSNIDGATTASYNDTGAPADGSGRYYKCVENATGATEQISTSDRGYKDILSVPIVETGNATQIKSSSATLHGEIIDTGGENADCQGFQWGLFSDNYTDNWTEAGDFDIGSFSHIISNLSKHTTYYFRAIAHNSEGWGYGNEVEFTTIGSIPNAPSVLTLTDLGGITISANWTAIENSLSYLLLVNRTEYPTSPAGQWEVAYSDNATSANLTGYSLDTTQFFFLYGHGMMKGIRQITLLPPLGS